MIYKVCLLRDGNENLPYVIREIQADNAEDAAIKAKEYIAHMGYWEIECMSIEERMKRLTIKDIVIDNI